jgi:hypothetical protein
MESPNKRQHPNDENNNNNNNNNNANKSEAKKKRVVYAKEKPGTNECYFVVESIDTSGSHHDISFIGTCYESAKNHHINNCKFGTYCGCNIYQCGPLFQHRRTVWSAGSDINMISDASVMYKPYTKKTVFLIGDYEDVCVGGEYQNRDSLCGIAGAFQSLETAITFHTARGNCDCDLDRYSCHCYYYQVEVDTAFDPTKIVADRKFTFFDPHALCDDSDDDCEEEDDEAIEKRRIDFSKRLMEQEVDKVPGLEKLVGWKSVTFPRGPDTIELFEQPNISRDIIFDFWTRRKRSYNHYVDLFSFLPRCHYSSKLDGKLSAYWEQLVAFDCSKATAAQIEKLKKEVRECMVLTGEPLLICKDNIYSRINGQIVLIKTFDFCGLLDDHYIEKAMFQIDECFKQEAK